MIEAAHPIGAARRPLRDDVILAHPGAQHSRQTALALQDAGLLRLFLTGTYYRRSRWQSRCLAGAIRAVRPSLARKFLVTRDQRLDDARIRTRPWGEIAARTVRRSPGWKIDWFDRQAAAVVRRERPRAVICADTSAVHAFAAAREVGAVCILDQTIGHLSGAERQYRAYDVPVAVSRDEVDRSMREIELADYVLAGSEYVKSSLVDAGVSPARISIIPYGVDVAAFHPAGRRGDGFRVAYVGLVSHRKGIQYVVDAFERCADLSDLQLWIIGQTAGSTSWMERFGDRLRFFGKVPHARVAEILPQADVFVFPSLREGSANCVYEALACGLPVITTPNAGSVVRDGEDGFLVAPGDVGAMVERLRLLYGDRALHARMAASARSRAEAFPWARYREQVASFVRGVCEDPVRATVAG
jgi:glycosyltransferase involved in cell wall biosynthesis